MFFKKDNMLEAAQDEANQIGASLDNLNQLIKNINVTNFDHELGLIHKDGENKIRHAVLKIRPIIKPTAGQPDVIQQIITMRETIYNEHLTIKRNLLLNKISDLQLDLYMICITVQSLIIQNQYLIDNTPDIGAKKQINSADKLLETLLDTLSVYNVVSNSFLKSSTTILKLLESPNIESFSPRHRQQRAAIYSHDAHFQQFNHFIDSFSERILFSSLEQLIDSFEEDNNKAHWKQSLSKFWPVIGELEQAHTNLFAQCSNICSCLQEAKKSDEADGCLKTEPKL